MSEGFIQLSRSEEAIFLATKYPNAFLLLTHIAFRARRYSGGPDGLLPGQCHIGDFKECGIESEKKYRTAKEILKKRGHLLICETCRTRKKGATGSTTIGTLVKLISTSVYDINLVPCGDPMGDRGATEGRPEGDELIKKECNKDKKEQHKARSSASPTAKQKDFYFDHEEKKFVGITDQDVKEWRETYTFIDLHAETLKAKNWLLSNPSKAKKQLWRKFLTGWFNRSNESAQNKKAYASQKGNQKPESVFGSENLKEYADKW